MLLTWPIRHCTYSMPDMRSFATNSMYQRHSSPGTAGGRAAVRRGWGGEDFYSPLCAQCLDSRQEVRLGGALYALECEMRAIYIEAQVVERG